MAPSSPLYSIPAQNLRNQPVDLAAYKGKVLLVVNTASKCGYTPQYKDLQALHEKYSAKGFTVLGFPSNDFGAQEPGTAEEIGKFCEVNYGVKFPLFAKGPVKGEPIQPVYKFLTQDAAEKGDVSWNFEKFLVSKSGHVVGRFKSKVAPMSPELTGAVEKALAAN